MKPFQGDVYITLLYHVVYFNRSTQHAHIPLVFTVIFLLAICISRPRHEFTLLYQLAIYIQSTHQHHHHFYTFKDLVLSYLKSLIVKADKEYVVQVDCLWKSLFFLFIVRFTSRFNSWINADGFHLDCNLKEIIIAFSHGLGLLPRFYHAYSHLYMFHL